MILPKQDIDQALETLNQTESFKVLLEDIRERREGHISSLHAAQTDFELRIISGKIQECDSLLSYYEI